MPVGTITADRIVFNKTTGKPVAVDSFSHSRQSNNRYHGRSNRPPYECRAEQRVPRFDLIKPGMTLALDCEGVLLADEEKKDKNGLGRVSIVNESGEVIYDTFAHYGPDVNHRPHPQIHKLGVKYNDIKPQYGAKHVDEVTRDVTEIFDRARGIVVGHAVHNEVQFLKYVPWDRYKTADTQHLRFPETNRLGLREMASAVLGCKIQAEEHSSIEDAQATMALYLLHQSRAALNGPDDWSIDISDSNLGSPEATSSRAETPATSLAPSEQPIDACLQVHRASIPIYIAAGHRVALPNILEKAKGHEFLEKSRGRNFLEMAKGRKFDGLTSTYY